MEQPKKARKWPFVLASILLSLILLIGGIAGYLYFSIVKAPLELDDPRQLAASTPIAPGERFRFSSSDQTVQVLLDRADLWTLILDQSGDDFLAPFNQELSAHDLSITGCAIRIAEEGLRLDLELYYRDVRLVAHVPCAVELSGQTLILAPKKLILGQLPLPVGFLLASLKLELDLDLPVIGDVTGVALAQDSLILTGSGEQDILELLDTQALTQDALFSDSLDPLMALLLTREGCPAVLTRLAQDPGLVESFYRELFILADPEITAAYQTGCCGLTPRFLPGIDFSAVAEAHAVKAQDNDALWLDLEQFFTPVVYNFNNKTLRLSQGQFLLGRKEFHPSLYVDAKNDKLFQRLDPDSCFLVLVQAEDGFIRRTPSLKKLAGEKEDFTQSVDRNLTYILGFVFRSPAGQPYLIYEREEHIGNAYSRILTPVPLTEEELASLQVPGKFGVFIH